MLMCKNKTFNKIFFFSVVFFIISFVSHLMICYTTEAAPKKQYQVTIQESTSHIQIQQREIIDQLEDMEQKYVKQY